MDHKEFSEQSLAVEAKKLGRQIITKIDRIIRVDKEVGFNDDTPDSPHKPTLESAISDLRESDYTS